MYTTQNFKTKKELVAAVEAGHRVTIFAPGGLFPGIEDDGTAYLEGPHYPAMHSWYASCKMENGIIARGSVS